MGLTFDPECQRAVDVAKRAVPEGGGLEIGHLLSAVCHQTMLRQLVPELCGRIPAPEPIRSATPAQVALSDSLKPIFRKFITQPTPVTVAQLFLALADSDAGREFLRMRGVTDGELDGEHGILQRLERGAPSAAPGAPTPAPTSAWRASPERAKAVEALSAFGRMLTAIKLPDRHVVERDQPLKALVRTLHQMGRRNAIVAGAPGTGKTALVYELARWMLNPALHANLPPLPDHVRDGDIFELSPVFLRSGASFAGQYEERVKSLLQALRTYPQIILFVDEIHSLFQSGVHDRGPFSDANEAFKAALGHNEICCIGCTTLAEYRRFIEPDRALARRFALVLLEPPSRSATIGMLGARLERVRAHYAPLRIPESLLPTLVDLTDRHLPAFYQPDKSIQLLDAACASCTIAQPPAAELTEDALLDALADTIGYRVEAAGRLTVEDVRQRLAATIVGQDAIIDGVARAFVAGMDRGLREPSDSKPRGVFFFGGPTGVGKTQTALILAELLGGGHHSLIQIDCNTLLGSGFDSGPAINRLLGVPPGYVGYARGQGGLLSRVRDAPRSVVLFDEFEKADPGVGRILLQVLDQGRVEDTEGTMLDFGETFIIFTSNAGCVYGGASSMGFGPRQATGVAPRVDARLLWDDLRRLGLGQEFEGRIQHQFLFAALDQDAIREVLARNLTHLADAGSRRGWRLEWTAETIDALLSGWQSHLGARDIIGVTRTRIEDEIRLAGAEGGLAGVTTIRLAPALPAGAPPSPAGARASRRWREGTTLHIAVA